MTDLAPPNRPQSHDAALGHGSDTKRSGVAWEVSLAKTIPCNRCDGEGEEVYVDHSPLTEEECNARVDECPHPQRERTCPACNGTGAADVAYGWCEKHDNPVDPGSDICRPLDPCEITRYGPTNQAAAPTNQKPPRKERP